MIMVRTLPHWFQALTTRVTVQSKTAIAQQQAVTVATKTLNPIQMMEVAAAIPTMLLSIQGSLDRHTYLQVIDSAATGYERGARQLVIDLGAVTTLELSGLFALYSVARLYAGEGMLDPKHGWATLREAASTLPVNLAEPVKLVNPSPLALAAIRNASFCRFFEIYADLATALAAYAPATPELQPVEQAVMNHQPGCASFDPDARALPML
jgi:hypothetical protein